MFLAINHGFRSFRRSLGHDLSKTNILGLGVSWVLTFSVIVLAWTIFRSESINGAHNMLQTMLGLNGLHLPEFVDYQLLGALCFLLFVVCFMPSTQEYLQKYNPSLNIYSSKAETPRYHWIFQYKPSSFAHILFVSLMVMLSIVVMVSNQPSEFLYYNF